MSLRASATGTDVTVTFRPRARQILKSYVPRREKAPREARPEKVTYQEGRRHRAKRGRKITYLEERQCRAKRGRKITTEARGATATGLVSGERLNSCLRTKKGRM